ncbi:hypothetical protein SK128_015803 [Halocaridina rubra]|uniref:Uncharacterized protein n=1 Tax=Halocaridina rubra TaxID=373956 RepID=A0AAN8XAW5_HALRR
MVLLALFNATGVCMSVRAIATLPCYFTVYMTCTFQIALSAEVFSESWRLDPQCLGETTTMELPSDRRAHHLCQRLIMDFTSPMLPCQETVDVKPYYETCLRYLSSVSNQDGNTYVHQDSALDQPMTAKPNISGTLFNEDNWNLRENATSTEISEDIYHSLSFQISFRDILFPYADARSSVIDATKEELIAICNIYAAYFGVCKAKDIDISLPPICGSSSRLSYSESVSSRTREVDIVLLVDESSCDSFMYQHLISPLPEVLERIALGKNISSVKMAAIGYGSGEGDIVYHIRGPSLLTSPSQIQLSQLHGTDPPRGPLIDGLRAVSNFPFRPGSIRVALVLRCSNQDIPQFTETLPKEMIRRRLLLFTLTPDLLVFNPTRPKAVRNTIGLDRWRIYSLRHDKQRSEDSWGVRRPDSNIARLAMKSGGGVFTVTPLRDEVRSGYYMKLFRKTLSRAILKTVVNVYNHHLKVSRGQQQL